MELTLVGLQHAGKTTFVNVIASGSFNEDMIPTVGFNMRKISKGSVTIKLWDIGRYLTCKDIKSKIPVSMNYAKIIFVIVRLKYEQKVPYFIPSNIIYDLFD